MSFLAPIAGAVVGGLMSDSGGGGQEVSKDPWGPTQQPLRDSLGYAQQLQGYQMQNPWNPMQQTAYQNTFTDLDAFREQNNGLMGFANRLMGSNYQRGPRQSQMEAMQGQQRPPMGQPQMMRNAIQQGLLSNMQPGVFSAPSAGSYGLLDFGQLNPFTSANGIPAKPVADPKAKTPEDIWREEANQRERDRITNYGGGD